MLSFILTLFRHGITIFGAYLTAHGIQADSTQGIVYGLILAAVPFVWSWIAKMLKFDPAWALDPSLSDKLRTGLGSLISQGVTFASTYYAVDANDPSALGIAVINAIASHYGVHQQIAHSTPLDVATAIKALALSSLLLLSSCAAVTTVMTWAASPAGQVVIGLAELGVKEAIAHGKISEGDVVTIKKATAIVTDQTDPTNEKVFKLTELGLDTAVAKGVVKPGDSLLIQEATAIIKSAVAPLNAKQPLNVSPKNPAPAPISMRMPACLRIASTPFRHAVDDAQGDPVMPLPPAMKQSGVSIPLYGARVAAALASR
jgi:hypothetical protein